MAWIIEASNVLFSGYDSAWVILVYYVGLTFIIGSIIWLILYVSPKLLQNTIGTSKNQITPPQPQEDQPSRNPPSQTEDFSAKKTSPPPPPVQIKWAPAPPEVPAAEEESDSEKLRREFRNRTF